MQRRFSPAKKSLYFCQHRRLNHASSQDRQTQTGRDNSQDAQKQRTKRPKRHGAKKKSRDIEKYREMCVYIYIYI